MAGATDPISARLDIALVLDDGPSSGQKASMSFVRPIAAELLALRPANDTEARVLDTQIRRALEALERSPAERWTVAKLARVAALSRAPFARRFTAEVGMPPLRYLASLRLGRAARLLATTDAKLAQVAGEVGYANEFALSRAFRRVVGVPPRSFRDAARATSGRLGVRCLAA